MCPSWSSDSIQFMLDRTNFEQRGPSGYWYRRGAVHCSPHELVNCDECGAECLWQRRPDSARSSRGRFCSRACSSANARREHYGLLEGPTTYGTQHYHVRTVRGTPSLCEHCGTTESYRFEWAHVHDALSDRNDVMDYMRLCLLCHKAYDK